MTDHQPPEQTQSHDRCAGPFDGAGKLLQSRLEEPSNALVEDLKRLDGDIIVLGAGGKLGPSLIGLALNGIAAAGTDARVIAVSRFSDETVAEDLRSRGASVIYADASDPTDLSRLPDAANIVYLIGTKFGAEDDKQKLWATNVFVPGMVMQRYRGKRLAVLSTSNVYPLSPVLSGGATELSSVQPVGEYAMSCVGRERMFGHFAAQLGGSLSIIRLSYAVEMRYGVLVDLAKRIMSGQQIDLATGHVNVVWQGYANEVILRSLMCASNPPLVLNVTGPETLSVRQLATFLGESLDMKPAFSGSEEATAPIVNASRCHGLFGYPQVPVAQLVEATAQWLLCGGATLAKPTKFEVRDGRF